MSVRSRLQTAFVISTLAFNAASCAQAQEEELLENTASEDAATLDQLHLFGDVLAIVKDLYVEEVDDKALVETALNGALESLDPHSVYIPPVQFEEQQESNRREYGGLGIEVVLENELVKVNYAIEDGPAYKAGLRSGDYITRVEGVSVRGKSLDQAVEGLRGLVGEPVTVTVLTPGKPQRDIAVTRATVQGRAVRHRMIRDVGYIFLETFSHSRLTKDTENALRALRAEAGGKLPGLVIDLRGNRGGLLDESISISGLFLDGGEVLSARGRTSRSFGKGSVQSVIPLTTDGGGALRLTTQRYFTPSGKSIQGRGIIPDIKVALLPDSGDRRSRFREGSFRNALSNPDDSKIEDDFKDVTYPPADWPEDKDFQLDTAIDILKTSRYRTLLTQQGW